MWPPEAKNDYYHNKYDLPERVTFDHAFHVVGVGNPTRTTELILGDAINADPIDSKLQESILKDIARRTRGEYLPALCDVPPLGEWFVRTIEQRPSRELADDVIPQPKDRATWFLAACFVLFCLAWLRDA